MTQKLVKLERKYHNKCSTKQEFDKLAADNFAFKLAQAKFATKADIAAFVKDRF